MMATWPATNWLRRHASRSSRPMPRAASRNRPSSRTAARASPRSGTVEQPHRHGDRERHAAHAEDEVGRRACRAGSRGSSTGVTISASMVPRSHSRAMTSAVSSAPIRVMMIGDEARHQEIAAPQLAVEPDPRLRDRPAAASVPPRPAAVAAEPACPHALDVAGDQAGRVGVDAVDDDLDRCAPSGLAQLARRSSPRSRTMPLDRVRRSSAAPPPRIDRMTRGVEVGRPVQAAAMKSAAVGAGLFDDKRQRHVALRRARRRNRTEAAGTTGSRKAMAMLLGSRTICRNSLRMRPRRRIRRRAPAASRRVRARRHAASGLAGLDQAR